MLSKTDIQKELGKGICLFPLNLDNIKENSINLCASEYAWATASREIYYYEDEYDKNKRFSLEETATHNKAIKIAAGKRAIAENKYIILLPLSTTLIETNEVLAVSSNIGGTYHSKVGLAAKGLGHIGTMVGPNFSGDSLIAIHNSSQKLVVLQVGESFVSVVFHYLNTPYSHLNPTTSGHTDKFTALGIQLSDDESEQLNADWKKQFHEVRQKMCESEDYWKLQNFLKQQKKNWRQTYISKRNIFIFILILAVVFGLPLIALLIDDTDLLTQYITVGCSGVVIASVSGLIKLFKPNSEN